MALNFSEFEVSVLECGDFSSEQSLAVAVSGGPDSMAMAWLLSEYGKIHDKSIYAYTIDHGLRSESEKEAAEVGVWLRSFENIHHKILKWDGKKPSTRILEEARFARYGLLCAAAHKDDCKFLFVAHHKDDQAETFLMRLAKGSGLDGLAGMKPRQDIQTPDGDILVLVRPLLDFSKEDLVQVCINNNIPFVKDSTNQNKNYFRPRLRAMQGLLEEEGLSPNRLATTAKRLLRARTALENMSQDLFDSAIVKNDQGFFIFKFDELKKAPEELSLRVMLMAVEKIYPNEDYGPRLERMENLCARIFCDNQFKSATLSGCLFLLDKKSGTIAIKKELI